MRLVYFSSQASTLWMQINQLEEYNLVIDTVALGLALPATLDSIPGIDLNLLPPGISELNEGATDYFEKIRDQFNIQIYQVVQEISSMMVH